MFRDESSRVQQKYRMALTKEIEADSDSEPNSTRSEHESNSSRGSLDLQVTDRDLPAINSLQISKRKEQTHNGYPRPALDQPPSDIAIAFFLQDYSPGSHFDYLPLLCRSSASNSVLTSIVLAVSFASLSHETQRPDLMALARQHYSHSLRETNKALRDPSACRKDGTLAAVLLLAHFETLASEDPTGESDLVLDPADANHSPAASWDRHLQGAVSLLAFRPKPTHDQPISIKLYQHVNLLARYSSVQHSYRVPIEMSSWGMRFEIRRDQADPNRRFMSVVDDFIEFRACMKEGSLTDPLEIIQRARLIDSDVALVARGFPSSWSFDVVTTSCHSDGVFKNKYHLYPTHLAAQLWNEVRMLRQAVNGIILAHIEKARQQACKDEDGEEIFSTLRNRCVRVIEQMATEICQSTTQFLRKPGSPSRLSGGAQQSPKTGIASAYFLIWPLFTATGASRFGYESIRDFVIDRLHFIARELNIPQARRVAVMLEQGIIEEDWLHMLHLF